MITTPLLLSDRYRIETFLGQGGMARVYLGIDQVLGRQVAVKVLAEHLASDPNFVRRFRREAQAAAGLSHPGVVAVFDTGSHEDLHYIVMELVDGRTLEQVNVDEGRWAPDRAVTVAEAVCAALAAAHEASLVHRDIKPANIMITPDGSVKVMDFGIARAAATEATLTQTSMVVGTATYLSPEQARGDRVDGRSDLYSLGVVLYEMLTGSPPFTADSAVAVAYKHISEEPAPPSALNPALDPELEAIVLKALAKDPGRRFQTADELRGALELWRTGSSTDRLPAVIPGPLSPTDVTQQFPRQPTAPLPVDGGRRRTPRRWKLAALLAATALATVILLVAVLASGTTPEDPVAPSGGSTSPTASPTATASPQPAALTVDEAVAALQTVVVDALVAGEISESWARRVENDANRALDYYEKGDLDKALGKVNDLRGKLGGGVETGEISEAAAEDIDQALADLAAAMEAAPIDTQPSDGGGGEGGDEEGD